MDCAELKIVSRKPVLNELHFWGLVHRNEVIDGSFRIAPR
jgi:hypothetical protein